MSLWRESLKTVGFQGNIDGDGERTQRLPLCLPNSLPLGFASEVPQGFVIRKDYAGNERNIPRDTGAVWAGDRTSRLRFEPCAYTLQCTSKVCTRAIGEGVQEYNRARIIPQVSRDKERFVGRGVLDRWILRGDSRRARKLGSGGEIYQRTRQDPTRSAITPLVGKILHTLRSCRRVIDSVATKRINTLRGTPKKLVWQRSFHDHIIRNDESLNNIREYITNNPSQWDNDEYNIRNYEVTVQATCPKPVEGCLNPTG